MVLTCCLVLALIFMTIQYFKLRANCEGGTGRNVVMLEEELDQVPQAACIGTCGLQPMICIDAYAMAHGLYK